MQSKEKIQYGISLEGDEGEPDSYELHGVQSFREWFLPRSKNIERETRERVFYPCPVKCRNFIIICDCMVLAEIHPLWGFEQRYNNFCP